MIKNNVAEVLISDHLIAGIGILSEADSVLQEIEKRAQSEFLPIVGPEKGKFLADSIRRTKPKYVLEVGTLIGYSAILMAKQLGKDVLIITIEVHENEAKQAEENIQKAKILPKVEVMVGDALQILPKLKGSFDFVFIDAEKTEYMDYLRSIEDRLHKGSVIVADNAGIFANRMKDYLSYVRNSGKFTSKYVPVGTDGLEISVRR